MSKSFNNVVETSIRDDSFSQNRCIIIDAPIVFPFETSCTRIILHLFSIQRGNIILKTGGYLELTTHVTFLLVGFAWSFKCCALSIARWRRTRLSAATIFLKNHEIFCFLNARSFKHPSWHGLPVDWGGLKVERWLKHCKADVLD